MNSWFNKQKEVSSSDSIEEPIVKRFLDDTPELRYWMKGVEEGAVSASITAKSVIRAINRGHTDIELLFFVNPQTKESYIDPLSGQKRTRFSFNGKTQSWMLDLDDIPGVDSIAKLRTTMIRRKVPLPYLITQTGPRNFHCFYHGHYGQWPKRKIFWLVGRWANVSFSAPSDGPEREEWDKKVHASGICVHHLRQHHGSHHMRVPGSLNANHRNADGTLWRCTGWRNEVYYDMHGEYVADVGMWPQEFIHGAIIMPSVEQMTSVQAPAERSVNPISEPIDFSKFIDPITDLIYEVFPHGFTSIKTDKLVAMLADNALGLAHGTCRIHQVTWAEELGITQYDVSRMIKRFIELGILEKVYESYAIGRYSKTYAAGALLLPVIGYYGKPMPAPPWVRWDQGTSNTRMLVDIRYFCSLGLSDEDVIRRLNERQAHRPCNKQRCKSDFVYALRKHREWMKKFGNLTRSWMPDKQKAKSA